MHIFIHAQNSYQQQITERREKTEHQKNKTRNNNKKKQKRNETKQIKDAWIQDSGPGYRK